MKGNAANVPVAMRKTAVVFERSCLCSVPFVCFFFLKTIEKVLLLTSDV
jgi:hypothetical protein